MPKPDTREGEAGRPASSSHHWLVRAGERAGFGSGKKLAFAPSQPIEELWEEAAREFGVSEGELASAVASYFRLGAADMTLADPHSTRLLPGNLVEKYLVYPVEESDRCLFVATADPTDIQAEREIGFTSGRKTVFRVAPPSAIRRAISLSEDPDRAVEEFLAKVELDNFGEDPFEIVQEMEDDDKIGVEQASAPPVMKLTSLIIRGAIEQGASDIHIEPGRKQGVVRYRVDGVLHQIMELPIRAMVRLISRIKIMSALDISDRLRPQDGKAKVRFDNSSYDLRVSTIPSTSGVEKCVIRILDSSSPPVLGKLGIPEYELGRLRQLMEHRSGVVIVTGPTGSGKTTTLYGVLGELADGKINIMTAEDPVEYEMPSITQTQIQTKQGVTFASALRAMLRQDPDVILVGEIRDEETASVAFRAAMTGHLVLATVHANDAVSAVARLTDLGLDAATIGSTLRGALAQRLLRMVCPDCMRELESKDDLGPEERLVAERQGVIPKVQAVGCEKCGQTGYRGRLPVQEVLVVDPRFQQAVEQEMDSQGLQRAAIKGGMRTMHQVAQEFVKQGKTTVLEVKRVLGNLLDAEQQDSRREHPRILLVEDDESARVMMRSLLEEHDYEVVEASSGEAAQEVLREDPDYSLVILDLSLPGMGGLDLLNWTRSRPFTSDLPVLVRTGSESTEVETELLDAGADDYITKSVDASRFIARIRAVIRRANH